DIDSLVRLFTKEELCFIISSLKIKSAHGPDLIFNRVIKLLPESILSFFLKLFNRIFHLRIYPDCWRQFFMIFIPKPGSRSLRPITLANSLLKIFERLIHPRLE
ncbi:RNA-directed DNA polymerase from mobile element jockey, partial [Harpegnathos saltator]